MGSLHLAASRLPLVMPRLLADIRRQQVMPPGIRHHLATPGLILPGTRRLPDMQPHQVTRQCILDNRRQFMLRCHLAMPLLILALTQVPHHLGIQGLLLVIQVPRQDIRGLLRLGIPSLAFHTQGMGATGETRIGTVAAKAGAIEAIAVAVAVAEAARLTKNQIKVAIQV